MELGLTMKLGLAVELGSVVKWKTRLVNVGCGDMEDWVRWVGGVKMKIGDKLRTNQR